MIEAVFVLLLWTAGGDQPLEYTPYEKLSECLSTKRKIKQNTTGGVDFDNRWQCKELKVQMEQHSDGTWHIIKLMEDVSR
jgi:hypothetical protein|tara:strand:- start:114 stop:353 length:240 start_codon:yes stop_codon:yes gene_type:complete